MVFNIGDSLLMNNLSDYKYFKDKGIKIGHAFYGGDVRCWDAYKQEFNLDISTIEDQPINNYIFNRRITRLRKVELFADGIFSVLDQAGLAIRPFHRIYIPFECGKYNFRVQNRDIPVVVHIESRQPYKGEETIYAAVKKLQESGIKFIFKSYKGLTHSEVIDVLEDADILVDEVINFGPGTLGNEAIACGCALAVKVQEGHMARDYFCDIDELNIFQALAEFITNKEKRISSVYKAYDILKSENNLESIANDIIAKIGIDPMDFKEHFCTPSFFLEKYELPAGHIMSKKNKKLTRMVIEKFYPQNPEMINSLKLRNLI
jgi:hypothetical protein